MNEITFGPGACDLPSPDPRRLTEWLGYKTKSKSIKLIDITQLHGGALHENWICKFLFHDGTFNGQQEFVLRMASRSKLPQSLNLSQEFNLLRFLSKTPILVPKVFFLAPPSTVSDKEVLFMEVLKGTTSPTEVQKNAFGDENKNKMTRLLGQYLAHIHNVLPDTSDLIFLTTPQISSVNQNILMFKNILDTLPAPLPLLEWAIRWLDRNAPAQHELVLSHGDFRIGNILFNGSSLSGILDWEFASWGEPLEDIGWLCARCWRYGNDSKQVGGIGELSEFIAGYNEISSRTIDWPQLPYWEILATVKWAIIAHQQGQRRLSGRTKQLELLLTGQKADELEHDILTQIKNFDGNINAR